MAQLIFRNLDIQQLLASLSNGSELARYYYDERNLRRMKLYPDRVTGDGFFYDLSGRMITEVVGTDPENNIENRVLDYIWLGDRILAMAPSSGETGCFVATAAFGTAMAGELDALRMFRDRALNRFSAGRAFVKFYYDRGPAWARAIQDRDGQGG